MGSWVSLSLSLSLSLWLTAATLIGVVVSLGFRPVGGNGVVGRGAFHVGLVKGFLVDLCWFYGYVGLWFDLCLWVWFDLIFVDLCLWVW